MTIFEKMALFFKRNKQKKLPLPKKQEEDLKNKKQKFKDEIAQKATDMEKTQLMEEKLMLFLQICDKCSHIILY